MLCSATPLPPHTRLKPTAQLAIVDEGRTLIGGHPLSVVRLSRAGAELVKSWLRGEPVGDHNSHQELAKRLLNTGMFLPTPEATLGKDECPDDITVVVPVRNDSEGLNKVTAQLRNMPIVVVDDGSTGPLWGLSHDTPAPPNVTVITHERNLGPAAARQSAVAQVDSPLVAFVDAGVGISHEQLGAIQQWFSDPDVVAVAPRISVSQSDHRVGRYEQTHSPLDMGPSSSLVGPGRLVRYVPSTVLVVRVSALKSTDGFDPGLRFGEDVDLVWRLSQIGAVVYDSGVVVDHPPRETITQLAQQRFGYGTAAAPLAKRHGNEVAPIRVSALMGAVVVLAVRGRWKLACGLWAISVELLARQLDGRVPNPRAWAAAMVLRSTQSTVTTLVRLGRRDWWPATALVGLGSKHPHKALVVKLVVAGWLMSTGRPRSVRSFFDEVGLAGIEDVSYGAGVWVGAIRHRSLKCLLPRLTAPNRASGRRPTGK